MQVVSKAKLALALCTLILQNIWAVPAAGTAHSSLDSRTSAHTGERFPRPIRLREESSAGLLVTGWVNDAGPFKFVIDTGADVSIVSRAVAQAAGLHGTQMKRPVVAGLSNARIAASEEAISNNLALGTRDNAIPGKPLLAIAQSLPGEIDGVLNPSDLFGSFAYSIDFPNRQLLVFDSKINPLDFSRAPRDGAIVRWTRVAGSSRPFVRLGDGRLALVDTGSSFGLAVNETEISKGRNHSRRSGDLGGGTVQSRELEPSTVSIGDLVLRNVPTQVLVGVSASTPVILGRRALHPFKITFDPVARLIAIEPVTTR